MSSSLEAEKILKKLRKLEVNMVCPNCATKAVPGVGFGNVCMKFKTFICDLCKTSHQAISHRVKSFSMSTWTMDEVLDLTIERNGGNEAALHIWLANAPPPGGKYAGGIRPKSGDDVNVFKRFVTDCYEHGKFKASTPFMPMANESNSINTGGARSTSYHNHSGNNRSSLPPPAPIAKTEPRSPKSLRKVGNAANIKTTSPEVDLLGFDMPSTTSSSPSGGSGSEFGSFSVAPNASNHAVNNNTMFDPFSNPTHQPTTTSAFDPFGNDAMVPAFTTTTSSFTASTPNLNPTNIHNHFSTQSPPPQQQPVMSTSTFPSSFDPFSPSSSSNNNNNNNNLGGNNNNNGGNNNGRRTADVLSLFDQAPTVPSSAATTTTGLNNNRAASISGLMAPMNSGPPRPPMMMVQPMMGGGMGINQFGMSGGMSVGMSVGMSGAIGGGMGGMGGGMVGGMGGNMGGGMMTSSAMNTSIPGVQISYGGSSGMMGGAMGGGGSGGMGSGGMGMPSSMMRPNPMNNMGVNSMQQPPQSLNAFSTNNNGFKPPPSSSSSSSSSSRGSFTNTSGSGSGSNMTSASSLFNSSFNSFSQKSSVQGLNNPSTFSMGFAPSSAPSTASPKGTIGKGRDPFSDLGSSMGFSR